VTLHHIRVQLIIDDEGLMKAVRASLEQLRRHCVSIVPSPDAASPAEPRTADAFIIEMTDGSEQIIKTLTASGSAVLVIISNMHDPKTAFDLGAADVLASESISAVMLDHVIKLAVERQSLLRERDRLMSKLSELIISDDLTALANRRHLLVKLSEEINRSNRTGHMFAVTMVDIDRFNAYNISFGHRAGDERLKSVAAKMVSTVRSVDFVARYGGDEFCIIFPESTMDGVRRAVERMQEALAALDQQLTISVGTSFWQPEVSCDSMLREANRALKSAKTRGGNCSVFAENITSTSSTAAS